MLPWNLGKVTICPPMMESISQGDPDRPKSLIAPRSIATTTREKILESGDDLINYLFNNAQTVESAKPGSLMDPSSKEVETRGVFDPEEAFITELLSNVRLRSGFFLFMTLTDIKVQYDFITNIV